MVSFCRCNRHAVNKHFRTGYTLSNKILNFKEKTMAVFFKIIKNLLFTLVLTIGLYILATLILSLLKTHPQQINCKESTTIFISSNGIHLDVIVPIKDLEKNFAKQLHLHKETQFVAFGWGDKNFYLHTPEWKDLTVSTALKALFLKSESAIHVTSYGRSYTDWKEIMLCPEQLDALISGISSGFKRSSNKELLPIGVKGYGYNDRFYEAHGSFTLFKTCNVWVNNMLKLADIQTSLWSPFHFGVLYHLP